MKNIIKTYWPSVPAALFLIIAALAAFDGIKVSTGYTYGEEDIMVGQPFAGGVLTVAIPLKDMLSIFTEINAAVAVLLTIFWVFLGAAIIFIALQVFFILRLRRRNPRPAKATSSTRQCPFCAEDILANAKVCKHCKKDLPA